HQYHLGLAFLLPLPTAVLEVADELLLLRVDRDHGLVPAEERLGSRIDVFKLLVAIRMRGSLAPFLHRMQPVAKCMKEPPDCRRADLPPFGDERGSQLRPALAGPAQWRRRVSPGER